jgi:hypothetical protein
MSETESQRRRRWINLGELIALAALIVSAVGVWISWKSITGADKPTTVVEQRRPIPLTLRGKAENDGRSLEISPVEQSHALQSLKITPAGSTSSIDVGSDGELSASDVENALGAHPDVAKGNHRLRVRIQTDFVEAGNMRHSSGEYVLTYRWEGGGLFGGHSLHLVSLSRG